ncbi:replication initiator protein A [Staphylococcus equorum]|uniref:replication initiator protein A n=1 Tax=Staphylococcus equorum TaxID=246432 RepID=UPI001867685A|nr:replication initiator protein A [Staphylococcus equorum]
MTKNYHTLQEEYKEKFYRLPKVFFTNERYQKLSNDAKMSYAILQDRLQLSIKNNWVDEETGHIYFVYTNEKLQEILNCGKNYPTKIKKELVDAELLEVKKRGKNVTDQLFLLKPEVTKEDIYEIDKAENDVEANGNKDSRKTGLTTPAKRDSGLPTKGTHDSRKTGGNDTELSKTDFNETEYNNNTIENHSGGCGDSIESIYEIYKSGINSNLSAYIKNNIKEKTEQYGKDLVVYALEQAIYNGKTYNYAVGVLKNLETANIKTVEDAEQARNNKKATFGKHMQNNLQSKEMTPKWLEDKENKKSSESKENEQMTEKERLEFEKKKAEFLESVKQLEKSY